MKKQAGIWILTAVLAAGMAACGQSGQGSSSSQAQTETAAVTEAVDETAAESTAESAAQSAGESADEAESAADTQEAADSQETGTAAVLEDGVYAAAFQTDSSMFHANEACQGMGRLTVENGQMTIHVSLVSQSIVNLFPGTAEDAQKEGAQLLEPVTDTVYYSDGTSEEVYGFDIPVPAIGEDFDLAIIGTKGKWYDHKVSVTDPVANGRVPGYESEE